MAERVRDIIDVDLREKCSDAQADEHMPLFDATPGCNGRIVPGDCGSGIKCDTCSGWFCF